MEYEEKLLIIFFYWKKSPDTLKPGEILPIGPKGYDPAKGDVLPYKRILDIYDFRYTLKLHDYILNIIN